MVDRRVHSMKRTLPTGTNASIRRKSSASWGNVWCWNARGSSFEGRRRQALGRRSVRNRSVQRRSRRIVVEKVVHIKSIHVKRIKKIIVCSTLTCWWLYERIREYGIQIVLRREYISNGYFEFGIGIRGKSIRVEIMKLINR